jgi:acyl-CoA synthetase (AMP-forming)/AMP-acid ligase II
VNLTTLLRDGRPAHSLVAFAQEARFSFEQFDAQVRALAAALASPPRKARSTREGGASPERWILQTSDSYSFAVGLFALWHHGGVAVLPPNAAPGTLARLAAEVAGAISDRLDLLPGGVLHPLRPPVATAPPLPVPLGSLLASQPAVELFTSGTTGDSKVVEKVLRHLDDEVQALEACFGALCADASIFATASHQHLYGLLFRVLWPLAASRPFRAETYLHPAELVPRMMRTSNCVLIGTPAHLRRMRDMPGLEKLRGVCRCVFSSGGPLDEQTADALAGALGEAPIEIFGSTETGGVAMRQQKPGPGRLAFTPLPGVAVERAPDGCARIRSPFVSAIDAQTPFTMSDHISLQQDGRFLLEGRADRVVKVGEKRLSLPDMEQALRRHPWVSEVALIPLGKGPHVRVGAVIVPSEEGRSTLSREGRRAVSLALGSSLELDFDRVLLPRAHRYVDALPSDERGKVNLSALGELFARGDDAPVTEPEIVSELRSTRRLERALRVPADLAFLEGHFPGFPVVPGVVQLRWALRLAAELLEHEPRLASVEALKFRELLRPGDIFRAAVELSATGDAFEFRLWSDDPATARVFSTGRCVLRRKPGDA